MEEEKKTAIEILYPLPPKPLIPPDVLKRKTLEMTFEDWLNVIDRFGLSLDKYVGDNLDSIASGVDRIAPVPILRWDFGRWDNSYWG